ncbi:glucose dehydrogenase [FAD, quinone]-like [Spodoptera litura]|uniref:Glucose dehydrogenase [FAD, quinone]-like n=1 Tax=Spodoptera litura TaxID=69820 RepID=A0A9J7J4A1_SPOLT|nr:glucose dehydrogenase [FAD, quinone]-like [Spodoptera litura]
MQWQPVNLTEACPEHAHHLSSCTPFGFIFLNLVVQLYGGSRDKRIQQGIGRCYNEDYEIEMEPREEYDFIVVGAGSAGCVVANRLSAVDDWKVLLLEAGIEQPDVTLVPGLATTLLGSNIDWSYATEPNGKSCLARRGQSCGWPRGKVMGGSSSINSLAYVRGSKEDYDEWAALGNDGWSYKDVLPYFKKSERNLNIEGLNRKYHGVDGEQYISRYPNIDKPAIMMIDAFHEGGVPLGDFNGAHSDTTMYSQSISKDGVRVSTNNAFIQPIRYKRKNLTVKSEAEVTKVLINKKNVAYGVRYTLDGMVHTAYAKKEVIVSAGSINSPKLLMLSGVGPREHLEELNIPVKKDLAVGENLHDHVTFNGILVVLPNGTDTRVSNEEMLEDLYEYRQMEHKHGPLSSNGPISAIAFIKTEPDLPAPDIQYQIDRGFLKEFVRQPALYDEVVIYPSSYYDCLIPRTMNLVPKSRGKLLLNPDDPNGKPLIYANYFEDPTDIIPIVKGVKFLIGLEKTRAFRSMGAYFDKTPLRACKQYRWGTDSYIECLARSYTSTTYHPVGTCKMGPSWDEKAVVDPRLKVYGISNLRVIDSSIMPIVNRGNTNAPSIMIGERGVAFVLEDWLKDRDCDRFDYDYD